MPPFGAEGLGKHLQAAAQAREVSGERTLRRALADVRVPAADVDEAQPIFVAHEPRHAFGLELEALGVDGAAVGGEHFLRDLLGDFLPKIQAVAHRRLEMVAGVHVAQYSRLALVERRFADVLERQVRHRSGALEGQRQCVREGDGIRLRSGGAKRLRQTAEKAGAVIACASRGLPELDAVLGLEMAAR